MSLTRRQAFNNGLLAVAPIVTGVIPFGMICGVTAIKAGLSPTEAMGMSFFIFAGASQLAAIQLLAQGALPVVIVFTALVINLRFAMYSASLAPHFQHLPKRWRWPLAYLLTDQAYVMSINRYLGDQADAQTHKHWFYLGVASTLWLVWQPATAAGILLGAAIPASWSLDFAIPLTFMALLVPGLRDSPTLLAALVGGALAVAAADLPFNLGLMLAAVGGVAAGLIAESLQQRKQGQRT
ncbi:AzlC family ABC transporter permease [Acidihalobacter ferrooxydans]|uniref:Branched-chain amino acid ABC transporter permease n=1 Tax=Acidihalobacter ferrooxydans TaxID=1765967 RepID=A0A1P8UES8_9GAMM|nr:AzlC family ABC transporter permease [Acidihalobacter ferrooxydans]APZ42331.1 branched-chain amino acid ABC transporter permease [Acidihalobacter ferrooxydans]